MVAETNRKQINCLLNKEKLYLLDTDSLNRENNCFYVC